uniref:Bestrophin homolog n=1 Tax=Chlamydomonas leiostraca TaxID=1034604 RepID=A0A7S0RWR3_9CHLO
MQVCSQRGVIGLGLTRKGCPAPVKPIRPARRAINVVACSADKQDTRIFRRTVADSAFWERHRTEDRYTKNLLSMIQSRIIMNLYRPLSWVLSVAVVVGLYETARDQGTLDPNIFPEFLLANPQPQMLTSFAVSLLLSARTSQSYDRWWEARKVWGGILNRVRDVTTQCAVFFPEDQQLLRQACGRWTIAFTRALHAHLQDNVDVKGHLRDVLSASEMEMLLNSQHRVVKSLSVLAEVIKQAPMNPLQQQMMMTNVQFFYDALGMCERIYRTPMPLVYTRHTSRFLMIWLTTLPFGLWTQFHWATIPICLLVGSLLLGIDEIGVQIEEPFGVLPLDAICTRAELDARQVLNESGLASEYAETLVIGEQKHSNGLNGAKQPWEVATKVGASR